MKKRDTGGDMGWDKNGTTAMQHNTRSLLLSAPFAYDVEAENRGCVDIGWGKEDHSHCNEKAIWSRSAEVASRVKSSGVSTRELNQMRYGFLSLV
jgi:hypothetical protein